ncbi:CCA tRNA nucleotidyltransferase [Paenibacillus glycinis]|uniref:CCA tRNA nucleotidyltransferase n=1 Tax=Paenibacillus glycinis TaxID=2697035 RepID=A0ABW9XJ34_9BACL|nr:CCA tRNA nucleotidyltransferase [Paenibacillus glycinis]NBD22551.1 CCA tRNA nucleotidyltransferase [Paenibacillus glycinis]
MSRSEALTKALPLLYVLEERGFEAVFVGGCVRDTLLGKPLKDVDIATAASPEQVIEAFPHTIPTGLQHGTVTVVHEGETYEVTTFRTESEYERFRRPSHVEFVTSLREDLLRRDFTINSMAMRADGTLVDPFGGRRDIERGVLRCVGDADARLQEDALRIVRALRFAAAYELRIAHGTWRAIRRHKALLAHIAMERIGLEFDKMIAGAHPHQAAALLAESGLLACTKDPLPAEIVTAASSYASTKNRDRRGTPQVGAPASFGSDAASPPSWKRIASGIRALHEVGEAEDRWAALCAALSLNAEQASELFGLLRYSAARSSRLAAMIRIHVAMADTIRRLSDGLAGKQVQPVPAEANRAWIMSVLDDGQAAAQSWLSVIGRVPSLVLPDVTNSDERRKALDAVVHLLQASLEAMPAAAIRDLAVKGKDLLGLTGRPSGPWLGRLLQQLLQATALGEVPNEKDLLLTKAKKLLSDHER